MPVPSRRPSGGTRAGVAGRALRLRSGQNRPVLRSSGAKMLVFHLGTPFQERTNPLPVLPQQAEELLPGELVGVDAEESLHPPAQIGAPPGPQPMALGGAPAVAQGVNQRHLVVA